MNTASSRLLSLLSLLQARRNWPGAVLAQRLDVTPRTVRRDIERLRELGYAVQAFKGPDGGYRLDAGAALPPLLFDDDQAVALAVALQVAASSGARIEEAATRALITVRQVMPARLRHRIDAVQVTTLTSHRDGPAVDPAVLIELTTAIRAREVLQFDYRTAHPEQKGTPGQLAPPRRVEPHHVVARASRWCLIAWDLDRADWRTFRADRVTPRSPTGPRFTPRELPGSNIATFVDARFKGSADTDAWPCRGVVELGLPASDVAPFALDGVVEAIGPDRCRLTLGAWSWTGLAATLGRFDTDIHVIGPPQLKETFAILSGRFAQSAQN